MSFMKQYGEAMAYAVTLSDSLEDALTRMELLAPYRSTGVITDTDSFLKALADGVFWATVYGDSEIVGKFSAWFSAGLEYLERNDREAFYEVREALGR